MPHLKHLFWLFAWSLWAWLGVGLYRELPRQTGAFLCRLSLSEKERVIGFLGDEHRVVVERFDGPYEYSVFDIPMGARAPLTLPDRKKYLGGWRREIPNRDRWAVMQDRNWVIDSGDWLSTLERHFPLEWQTFRVKNADTGRIAFREWQKVWSRFRFQSEDDVFVASEDGEVRRYPAPNWPLLALCQTLLALPLILLWLALRWRSKRKASGGRQPPVTTALESGAAR